MEYSFATAVSNNHPLQVVGAINAYTAMMAENVGYQALYVSGAGVANASYGLPDLAITTLDGVLEDVNRITDATKLPVLVDIDTGFGGAFNIAKTIKSMIKVGASAVHIEDQQAQKRCGHRPGKQLVSTDEMSDRIKAAVDAKTNSDFTVMARTDAYSVEGLGAAIDRANAYINAGADMIFAEAMNDLSDYQAFTSAVHVPVLANITEFGQTPLFTLKELSSVDVAIALYPLSAFRAMNQAALNVYQAIKNEGTQKSVLHMMQNRETLYHFLNYHQYEQKLDELFKQQGEKS